VKLEFDPEKSAKNAKERDLPFELAANLDWIASQTIGTRLVAVAPSQTTEIRYVTVAPLDGRLRLHVVVYCMRGVNRRVISLRRANEKEEQAYVKANETEKQAYEKVLRPPLRPLTDEDGEVRELTEEDFRDMRPLSEVDPGMIEAVEQWRRELAHDRQHDLLTISIALPEADLKHIDEFASAHGLTRSEFFLRAAIRETLRTS
jgi:uncharacterized protein